MRTTLASVLSITALLTFLLPERLPAQEQQGIELYRAGKYQEAERLLRESVTAHPDDQQARYLLGLSLLELKSYVQAQSELEKVHSSESPAASNTGVPGEGELKVALARAYMGQKKYAEAQAALDAAQKASPEGADVYLYRGKLDIERRMYPQAVPELEKAISLDPKNAYAHYYAGIAYSNIRRPDKMVEQFEFFLKLAPNAPEADKVRALLRSVR
jgi:tetratricopeptide (TPR) repeat protein